MVSLAREDGARVASDDEMLDALARGLEALARGNPAEADAHVLELQLALPERVTRPPMSPVKQAMVFRRDFFRCLYCGSRVVPTIVLRAVSLRWPQLVPYHPNWRADATHPLIVHRSATVDHVEAHAQGGGDQLANLATACWPCNVRKGELDLETFGKPLRKPGPPGWDGLTSLYPSLWKAVSATATESERATHRRWIIALAPNEPV